MGLIFKSFNEDELENFKNKMYNVEYELGNGKIQTFSNILEHADGDYFWFNSKENGLCVIKQNRILTMVYTRNKYDNINDNQINCSHYDKTVVESGNPFRLMDGDICCSKKYKCNVCGKIVYDNFAEV